MEASPPTITVRAPFSAPLTPPLTGASMKSTPCCRSRSAITREVAGSPDVQSTSVAPRFRPARRPLSPSSSASTSGELGRQVMTTSAWRTASAGVDSARAFVAAAKSRARDVVRFQTASGNPASATRRAIGAPMAPRPMKETFMRGCAWCGARVRGAWSGSDAKAILPRPRRHAPIGYAPLVTGHAPMAQNRNPEDLPVAALVAPDILALLEESPSDIAAETEELHPADLADVVELLPAERVPLFLAALPRERAADVLEYLNEELRAELLEQLSARQAAELVTAMTPDDRAA